MYLSGQPLHVLSTNLAAKFREQFGGKYAISFSAGIDRKNFPDAVAGDLVPITTCTDLLRAGGYGRLPGYLEELAGRMKKLGVRSRSDYVLAARGEAAAAGADVLGDAPGAELGEYLSGAGDKDVKAWLTERGLGDRYDALVTAVGTRNLSAYAAQLRTDPRYAYSKNNKAPRKIGSTLWLFDCITCDKCIPVCPNDANFFVSPAPIDQEWEQVVVEGPGKVAVRAAGKTYKTVKEHQIANFADFCNECGNCDVFCPEDGGPYVVKPRFFSGEASYREAPEHDGFYLERVLPAGERLRGRIEGSEYTLVREPGKPDRFEDDALAVELDPETGRVLTARPFFRAAAGHTLPTWRYLAMRALLVGVLEAGATTYVGALHAATAPDRS